MEGPSARASSVPDELRVRRRFSELHVAGRSATEDGRADAPGTYSLAQLNAATAAAGGRAGSSYCAPSRVVSPEDGGLSRSTSTSHQDEVGSATHPPCAPLAVLDEDEVGRPSIELTSTFDATPSQSRLLQGDVVRSACTMADLLPLYLATRDPRSGDDPAEDIRAMRVQYTRQNPRRSQRVRSAAQDRQASSAVVEAHAPPAARKRKRSRADAPALDEGAPARKRRKWLEADGSLATPDGGWSHCAASFPLSTEARVEQEQSATKRRKSHASRGPNCKTKRGKRSPNAQLNRTINRADVLTATTFDLVEDSSASESAFQGALPPPEARSLIDYRFYLKPRARALYEYICHFYPASYNICDSIRDERATFFVDRTGLVFMYRSYRAKWLMDRSDEVEEAHNILVGDDASDSKLAELHQDGVRGPHMPIIIGHQRQSSVRPYLTAWHVAHQDRVDKFLALHIVQRIISYISAVVLLIYPGLAKRFQDDAKWHEERYGIKPLFGLFWNLCLNAWFKDQRRIHCGPHADKKNQVGICLLLIYVLKSGKNFNHSQRTWLVIWEAAVAVQLPPWVIAMYPSALFYHFNIDVDEIRFVTTEGNVRPTRENSTPIVDGDDCGRGSFVFFNQSTMRHGPATGFDTLYEAKANGHPGVVDFGESIQEAFTRHVVFKPVDEALRCGDFQ